MRKGWIVLLTAVLVVALAAPAMADLKVSGFYRSKAMLSNFFDGRSAPSIRTDDEEQTNAYNEQRARIKFQAGTADVKAVFEFESDMNWGKGTAEAGRNTGGAMSADAVQLETKGVYVWFKIPDTSITASVGMQPFSDHYAGIFSNAADFTSIQVAGTFEPVKWVLAWGKMYESTNISTGTDGYKEADDTSIFVASAKFVPAKDMDLGVNFYYVKDDQGRGGGANALDPMQGLGPFAGLSGYKFNVYMPGVNFAMNTGIAKISAFAFYQFGDAENWNSALDFDIKAYMLDVRADLKVGPGNLFVEGFYISGGDQNPIDGGDYESPITLGDYQRSGYGTGGNSGFGRTNMYFLFGADSLNVSQCLIGCSGGELGDSFGNSGRGLWHLAAGYSQKFTAKLKGAVNIGTAYAVDTWAEDQAGAANNLRADRDKDIGTEFNVRLDYNISKGLDVSLVGAYLMLGDFVQNEFGLDEFKDSYYMGYARLGYSF